MIRFEIGKAAKLLKAIGNEKRLDIVYNLSLAEMSVGELEKVVDLSQSALSQHLAILRAADVVKTRRSAQTIYYSLKSEEAKNILELLQHFYHED